MLDLGMELVLSGVRDFGVCCLYGDGWGVGGCYLYMTHQQFQSVSLSRTLMANKTSGGDWKSFFIETDVSSPLLPRELSWCPYFLVSLLLWFQISGF